jgi:gamma-glutamyl-gamma-aminobutyrate hydrolase PuuD
MSDKRRVLIPYRHETKLRPYEAAARAGGLEPISILTSGRISLDGMAGLLLMGGTDVNPQRYGEAPHSETDQPDDSRDCVELDLIDQAIHRDLPILAICRGLQILNVYHGGSLIQHLFPSDRHDPEFADKSEAAHDITIEPETLLSQIAGVKQWSVNSRHHQAVNKIGASLRVSARDAVDGTVEGLERPDKHFVVAVQWHPEDQLQRYPEQRKLFQRFAQACDE